MNKINIEGSALQNKEKKKKKKNYLPHSWVVTDRVTTAPVSMVTALTDMS